MLITIKNLNSLKLYKFSVILIEILINMYISAKSSFYFYINIIIL